MKKPYQIESQRAVKQLEAMAADGNPAVQMVLPRAEMVGWLRKGVGELIRQAGLTNQFTHAFTQPAHHLGHGQHHLHRRISIRGHCLELLHSSLRLNLVWFLHSDSPFSRQKKLLSAYQRLRAGESLLSTIYRAFSAAASIHLHNSRLGFRLAFRDLSSRLVRLDPG